MHITDIINAAERTAQYWLNKDNLELHDAFKVFAYQLRQQHIIEINAKTEEEQKQLELDNKALEAGLGDHGQG